MMMYRVEGFIKGASRNKLIITKSQVDKLNWLDIGKLFSTKIEPYLEDRLLSFKALTALNDIIETNITKSDVFGDYIAIYNLGILFETELNIDFITLLDKHSRNTTLFMYWEGEIKNDSLYFLKEVNGQEINIKNLSHIII